MPCCSAAGTSPHDMVIGLAPNAFIDLDEHRRRLDPDLDAVHIGRGQQRSGRADVARAVHPDGDGLQALRLKVRQHLLAHQFVVHGGVDRLRSRQVGQQQCVQLRPGVGDTRRRRDQVRAAELHALDLGLLVVERTAMVHLDLDLVLQLRIVLSTCN